MSRIRSKVTKPEIAVRKICHSLGLRFRLHQKQLPGTPDLVFAKHKSVIFVNGCFWHSHNCKYGNVHPKTHSDFWQDKRKTTKLRDQQSEIQLNEKGWKAITVWECEIRNSRAVGIISNFFGLLESDVAGD